ncbi:MAG TPA: NAD-dependent epimerase/dehydratase family protein [Flavobacterium sp.]|nr:NAD-dependent epimerase/dehydratase family protein [Flavobacterium sp.]
MKKILVTGAAGFIGYHLCEKLVAEGYLVVGLDNINDYYDVNLKYARLNELGIDHRAASVFNSKVVSSKYGERCCFVRMNLEDREQLPLLFEHESFDCVISLGAQAGVRYSIENPMAYVDSNIVGFVNVLEACRHHNVTKLVYASSSSVYGNSVDTPFTSDQKVDHPISLYAATKKSNELMAYTYSHLYDIQTIGLRFFTVYGPWGRPDMAMFLFTDAILNNRPIKVFNNGDLSRDFTYIDDIISGVMLIIEDNNTQDEKYQLYNIGNSKPVQLLEFIEEIEKATEKKAEKIMMAMQPGDVNQTWADVEGLRKRYGYNPNFLVKEGVRRFVEWYKEYYKEV